MLAAHALGVRYGDVVALDRVDLCVADGEIVSVLGPSGSGKSTLLRVIAGLVPDAEGHVAWDGRDLTQVAPHRRGFGLMFQDHALFPHRDVLGNVAFGLRMRGLSRAQLDPHARATLALVGLAGFEHRHIAELSGGEQQRVALARALAPEPRLLMLDEPFGALDRALRDHLLSELRALFTALGLSVVFVSHDHDEAFALADRVLLMRDGRVVQQGTPADVWRRPADQQVARFLGWNVTGAFGGGARVAIRPEDLSLAEDGVVRGRVSARTFRRDHYLVSVVVDGAADEPELRVAVPLGLDAPEAGDHVSIHAAPGAAIDLPTEPG